MTIPGRNKTFSILLVIETYPPVLGGSEIEAQRVSAAMIRRGHRIRVLCAGGDPMPALSDWVDPAGVPVSILTRRSRGAWKDIVFAIRAASEICRRRGDYDVVYFLMQGLHVAAGLPVARLLHKPIVMKFSGSGILPLMCQSRIGRLELRWLRRWAGQLLVLNEGMVDEAMANGFSPRQLRWMPNPVDVHDFRPAQPGEAAEWRRRHGIPERACVVIYAGRLSGEKGLAQLLRGFAMAARSVPESTLVLVGDGPMRSELEVLARDLGLGPERLKVAGRVDSNEMPCWLRASDVFALTSPQEGFSCALLEAMAAGLPAVVSDIPANRQLIDPEIHGLTVPYCNEEAIAEALLRLFRDPERRSALGEAARRRVVENYSTEHIIDRYEELFASVIDSHL
jgi:glycosyltransferase involved in cell wall biosynthesis